MLQSEMRRQPRHALNLVSRIRLRIPRRPIAIILLPLPEIDTPSELADDIEVRPATYLGLEW